MTSGIKRTLLLVCLPAVSAALPRAASVTGASSPLGHGWVMLPMPARATPRGLPNGPLYSRGSGGPNWLASTPGGLMALGLGLGFGPSLQTTEWTSTNARSWRQISVPYSVFGQDIVHSAALGPSGLALVGTRFNKTPKLTNRPAAWFSPDGRTWRRATAAGKAFANGEMLGVTANGKGFVAVGDIYHPGDEFSPASQRMAVWVSPNGQSWQLVSGDQPVFQNASASVVLRGGAGLVALGLPRTLPGSATAPLVVWTSRDGSAWQRVPQTPGTVAPQGFFQLQGATAGRGKYVAWAESPDSGAPRYTLWTSTDGMHWKLSPGIHFQYGTVSAIVPHGRGFVAVGQRDHEPTLWSSPDGANWAPVVGQDVFGGGDSQLGSALDWNGRLLVVGSYNRTAPFYAPSGYTGPGPTYKPTAWLWQAGTRGQNHPNWPRTDPKWFRVRIDDLPAGFNAFGSDSYAIGCQQVPLSLSRRAHALRRAPLRSSPAAPSPCTKAVAALGRSLPYFFRFPYGSPTEYVPFVAGFSIVTSSAASAHAAFQYAGGLVSAVTADETVRPQPIRSLSLGQGAELFSQTLRSPCPAPPPQCPASENFGTGYAVVWWDGPTLGVVEVQGVPFDRQALAIRLARRQWTRRYAIHF